MASVRPTRNHLVVVALVVVAVVAAVLGSAVVATAAPTSSSTGHLVTYPGDGVAVSRLSGNTAKLHGTSRGFKNFVSHQLNVLWAEAGSKHACRHTPMILVKRYDGRFAQIDDEGWFASAGDPARCDGGGYRAIWKRTKGHWHEVLIGQDEWKCSQLRHYRVPTSMVPEGCWNDPGHEVPYVL